MTSADQNNMRKVLAADLAFDRWHALTPRLPAITFDMEGWIKDTTDFEREVFRAGYAAALAELAKESADKP